MPMREEPERDSAGENGRARRHAPNDRPQRWIKERRQPKEKQHHTNELSKVVETGCGQCLLGLKEKKIAIWRCGWMPKVTLWTASKCANSAADGGMCNRIHKANVTGQVVNGRFVTKTFEPLPLKK